MKKQSRVFWLPVLLMGLAGCNNATAVNSDLVVADGSLPSWDVKATANYYYNLKKTDFTVGDIDGTTNSLLFAQQELSLPCQVVPPTDLPERTGYDFKGWYEDDACEKAFDFANTTVTSSVFLYAGWEKTGGDNYTEPVYSPKKNVDDSLTENLRLDGVLNVAPTYGICYLPLGSMLRLEKTPSDVAFALNYTEKSGTEIVSATYDASSGVISVVSSNAGKNETASITVAKNTSADLVLTNATYEAKALAYEQKDADAENYHVLLAGSSSIEFWDSYQTDLNPIVAYNHGIGGTVTSDWDKSLLDRLILPYCPKAVVYYVGVNDLVNAGDQPATIIQNVEKLLSDTHAKLPNAHLFYVYINVLPGYFESYDDSIRSINAALAEYIDGKDWVEGVKAGDALLKESGAADAAYYRLDNLHMSEYGYVLWAAKIKKALEAWMG